jgi:hypothetical protein
MLDKMDEAKRMAQLRIKQQLEFQRRFKFGNSMQMEVYGLQYSKQLTRAYVFSYFDIIGWLGLDDRSIGDMLRE